MTKSRSGKNIPHEIVCCYWNPSLVCNCPGFLLWAGKGSCITLSVDNRFRQWHYDCEESRPTAYVWDLMWCWSSFWAWSSSVILKYLCPSAQFRSTCLSSIKVSGTSVLCSSVGSSVMSTCKVDSMYLPGKCLFQLRKCHKNRKNRATNMDFMGFFYTWRMPLLHEHDELVTRLMHWPFPRKRYPIFGPFWPNFQCSSHF
jgi:hypothetical protein